MVKEEWRDVVGYEGRYKVNDTGKVRSVGRYKQSGNQHKTFSYWVKGHRIAASSDRDGYKVISLGKDGERVKKKVHRLVADAFLENLKQYPAVNHIDSDRSNNRKENLEWCTNKMNSVHAALAGRLPKGEVHPRVSNSLTSFKFLEYWVDMGYTSKELQAIFKVSKSVISAVKNRKHWSSKEETLCQA